MEQYTNDWEGAVRLGNKRTRGDYQEYSIITIIQNNEKSPGDLRRLAITRNPLRNHHLTLVSKTLKWVKTNNSNKEQKQNKTKQQKKKTEKKRAKKEKCKEIRRAKNKRKRKKY